MLLDFRCRRCRAPLSTEADQKGNTIHCPLCACEMIVPAASEPETPRGQIVQGVYALLGEAEVAAESNGPHVGAGSPSVVTASPCVVAGSQEAEPQLVSQETVPLQLMPLQDEVGGEAILQSLSDGQVPKPKKKRRRRRTLDSPPRRARQWSRRAPVLAGALVLVIVVTCSAKRLGPGAEGETAKGRNAATATEFVPGGANDERTAFTLTAPQEPSLSFADLSNPQGPVVHKDPCQQTAGLQKGGPERESAGEHLRTTDPHPYPPPGSGQGKGGGTPLPGPVVPPPAPAGASTENTSSQTATLVIKRRRNLSEEDLRKDLRLMPEIPSLNMVAMNRLVSAQKVEVDYHQYIDHEPNILLKVRPDLKSLPVRKGRSCQLDKRSAANLGVFSQKLHALVDNPTPEESNGPHAMPVLLRKFMQGEVRSNRPEWLRPEAIPALQQILMQENKPLRWLLVEILAEIPGPAASVALAQRAIYDLSPEVRAIAIRALKDRPRSDFRPVLVKGLRYPWAPVADHAAEALVALKDQEVVPTLVAFLKEADPGEASPSSKGQTLWRETVRINHAANCLMCHPPAARLSDPLAAPVPGLVLLGSVPRSTGHYGSVQVNLPTRSGFFVRVDITYLRQDFSIREPSKTPGTDLVSYPRFDFLVRTRKVDTKEAKELKAKSAYQQRREAVLFALRELTGTDAGTETNAWAKLFPPAKLDDEVHGGKAKW